MLNRYMPAELQFFLREEEKPIVGVEEDRENTAAVIVHLPMGRGIRTCSPRYLAKTSGLVIAIMAISCTSVKRPQGQLRALYFPCPFRGR